MSKTKIEQLNSWTKLTTHTTQMSQKFKSKPIYVRQLTIFCTKPPIFRHCTLYIVGREVRFKCDAPRQRVNRSKQRKIDSRLKICFDGLKQHVAVRLERQGQNGERPRSGKEKS